MRPGRPRLVAAPCAVLVAAAGACTTRGHAVPPDASPAAGSVDAGAGDDDVVVCPDPVAAPREGACDVEPGGASAVLLRGTVLAPDAVYHNGSVLYDGNKILCVGCDCGAADAADGATVVSCGGGVISPGLINPHDHMTFTEGAPIDHGATRYDHRHEWRGALSTPSNPHGTGATSAGTRWGEVRMLLGGATSMVGSGRADGLVRNLDQLSDADHADGLVDATFETFPLGDANEQFHPDCTWSYKEDETEAAERHAFLPHVAEGINDYAAEEFRCESTSFDGGHDFTERNDSHIHGIGLTAADYYKMARDGTHLIWSPRSNISLYGHTALVTTFATLGGVIALGTDWTYSGSMNELRELACADQLNRDNLGGFFSDADLWRMATINAAIATGTDTLLGSLEPDKLADVTVFAAAPGAHHRAVIEAGAADVALVVRGGRALYGEADVVSALTGGCEELDVCDHARQICLDQEIGVSYAELAAAVSTGKPAYPAFFCGAPDGEPSCVPARPDEFSGARSAGDTDGDGIADGDDDCPGVFNPVRPMDGGQQADTDGDGQGDACDPSPVGEDLDGDGVANDSDDCPFAADPAQADADEDHKGDVCDFCPDESNPETVCGMGPGKETTIVDVQKGVIAPGTKVTIRGVVVTGVWANGVWAQQPGATEYGGIHIYTGANHGLAVNDQIDATGKVVEYFDDTELDDAAVIRTGTATPIPPLDIVVARSVKEKWEGMLLRVTDVTSIESPYDCGADNPACADPDLWRINGSLVVYERLYQDADWGARIGVKPVTGVMMTRFGTRRIMPRTGADL